MSFVTGDITFYEPGDLSLITDPASVQGLVAYNGNALYRLDRAALVTQSQLAAHTNHTKLTFTGTLMEIVRNGDFLEIRNPSGAACLLRFYPTYYAGSSVELYATFRWRVHAPTSYYDGHILTTPSGAGYNVYADDFIKYSSRAIKEDIVNIPNAEAKVKQLTPKKYKVGDIDDYGLIAEDVPTEFTSTYPDADTGEVKKGVRQGTVLAVLLQLVKELLARIERLEAKE